MVATHRIVYFQNNRNSRNKSSRDDTSSQNNINIFNNTAHKFRVDQEQLFSSPINQ